MEDFTPPFTPIEKNQPPRKGWTRPLLAALSALGMGKEINRRNNKAIERLYHELNTYEFLGKRALQLKSDWFAMCHVVLPVLRHKPYTHHTIRYLPSYGHGMVNRNPAARHGKLPEDWRLSIYLGKDHSENRKSKKGTSRAAVLSFSKETQMRQSKELRNIYGSRVEAAGARVLNKFKERDFTVGAVRSIWVGALRNSLIEPYIKVTNPLQPPEELLSIHAFRRLAFGDLENEPEADPGAFIYNTYCSDDAIEQQRINLQLMTTWGKQEFTGPVPESQ